MWPIRFINPYDAIAKASEYVMEGIHSMGASDIISCIAEPSNNNIVNRYEPTGSVAQATYLLPRGLQKREFLKYGYVPGKPGDYGLVKNAVAGRNLPIYQTAPDQISRDKLLFITNDHSAHSENGLFHAGSYPSAVYTDMNGNLYTKSWDLNDYGDDPNGHSGNSNSGFMKKAANFLDKIGSPTVVTTGYQRSLGYKHSKEKRRIRRPRSERYEKLTLTHPDKYYSDVEDFLKTKGLTLRRLSEITDKESGDLGDYGSDYYLSLPEVTIKPRKKRGEVINELYSTFGR